MEQSFGHYHGVSMKMGTNLLKLRQSGQLVFYEGLKELPELLSSEPEELSLVKSLYEKISSLVQEDTLLVVDQIFILSCLGLSQRAIYILAHHLVSANLQLARTQTVLRLYQPDCEQLASLVRRLGDLTMAVSGLQTGVSSSDNLLQDRHVSNV